MPFAFPRPVLGAACAALVTLAVVAARHASPAEVSPVLPRGSWNDVWIAALVAAFVVYAWACVATWRRGIALAAAVGVAVVVQSVTLFAPLLLSKDVYLYWTEARTVVVHHASPYRTSPSEFSDDPSLPWVSEEWRTGGAPYGPTWEVLALPAGAIAGSSHKAASTLYRVFAVLGVFAALAAIAVGTRNGAAVVLLGWNPLVALHFGGGGHNDGWLVALIAVGVLAGRRAAGGGAWALAGAFKPLPFVLLPLDLAASRLRRPARFWLGLAATAVLVLAASAAVWGLGWIHTALVGVHGSSPLGLVHWLTEAGLRHRYAVVLGGLVFAAVYVVLLVSAWRNGRARLSVAATALILTSSLVRPWYGIWPVALAALEEDALAGVLSIALSAYLLLGDAVQL